MRWTTSIDVQKGLKASGIRLLRAESKWAIGSFFALDRSALIPVFFLDRLVMCAVILFVEHLKFALITIETTERRMMRKKSF